MLNYQVLTEKITQNKSKHLLVENELNALKSKIPDVNGSSLVKKTDYNTKVAAIDGKVSNLDGKIGKTISKIVESFILLSAGDILFDGGDGSEPYLIFQPVYKYFKSITGSNYISSWKSKALSDESIKPTTTSDNSLTPLITYYDYDIRVKFNGSILRQSKFTYTHKKVENICIVYELSASIPNDNDPTLKNCLFGAVNLTKNADIEKYKYSDYGIGFDRDQIIHFQVVDMVKMY